MWYIGSTNSKIKMRHTKPYKRKMNYNKVEYSTAAQLFCKTHDIKVMFCMPKFSIIKIIPHRFHVDNDEGESGIGYDIIIGSGLVLQLGLLDDFELQYLQWYYDTVPIKEPSGMLGKTYLTSREMREVLI